MVRDRDPVQAVWRWPTKELVLGPKVCVFAHYDSAGRLREDVRLHLGALAAAGFSVVFASNAGSLTDDARTALYKRCAGVLVRRNVGLDFGAWREAMAWAGLPRQETEQILLVNDSVYGPFRPLDGLLDRVDFATADAWSCTESLELVPHLQSYWLAFGPAVIRSETWRRFWDGVRPLWSKRVLIETFELGLTQSLRRAGFRCQPVWPESMLKLHPGADASAAEQAQAAQVEAKRAAGRAANPSSDLWRPLAASGCPFLKRDLLHGNPRGVLDIAEWREVIGAIPGTDILPIERDLASRS